MRRTETEPSDVLIVGAGVIGLASAWRAAQRGLSVRVIDRETPGSGASRVAAGMLAPVGEASWGEEALLELSLASARAYPSFVAELERASGREVAYRRCGALHVALDRDEAEELRRRHELQRSLGLDATWMRPARLRELEPGLSPACTAGVHAADEAEVDPASLMPALAAASERAGVEVLPATEAREGLVVGGVIAGVRTADGRELRASRVVLAAGSWSGAAGWLPAEARPPVRPVKGQVVALRSPAEQPVCQRIVATERVYVVPRGDGRVVLGATVEERGFDVAVTAGGVYELLREAYRVLPEIAELELTQAVAGLRPGTPDNSPIIGGGALDGLVIATGHYRNGILLAPVTADAVAALLVGERPPSAALPMGVERFEAAVAR
ncbi:MAG TPA: glycine oxidase ThiO [Solirubrobacterales bacterium]|nr:glycine oxidase ThiO [Solirubrobacterales bacterium]